MRKGLFVVLFALGRSLASDAQGVSTLYDNEPPKEYAEHLTDIYAKNLVLSPEQKKETYTTILQMRITKDSIKANKIHIDADKLWAINNSLDNKYKEILNDKQYLKYEDMQGWRIFNVHLKVADSASSH